MGSGSFAYVKKAKNRKTGEYRAIKIYSLAKMNDTDIEYMMAEIEILK